METDQKKQAASRRKEAVAARKRSQQFRYRVAFAAMIVICLGAMFALGFFVRGIEPVVTRLGLVTPGVTTNTADKTVYNSISPRVEEIEDLLSTNSFDEYEIDEATEKMLTGLVGAIDDPYFRYFTAARYDQFVRENAATDYQGIGVLFSEYEGKIYAADVFDGSVAQLAGVQIGDILQSIDGVSQTDVTVNEVVSTIASKEGSVVVGWTRPASLGAVADTQFTTSLTCRDYKEQNVSASLDGEVGCIGITQLSQNSASLVRSAIEQLSDQGARAFVLDLRDCSGGYLTQAIDTASAFVKSGTLVQIKTKNAVTNKTASGDVATAAPLVVIINERTAGAAEVLASALRDNGRAQLVGSTTLGKGSIQVIQTLSFGGAIRYTAAYYLSPSSHDIDGYGVSPDVVVDNEETQFVMAQEMVEALIGSSSTTGA